MNASSRVRAVLKTVRFIVARTDVTLLLAELSADQPSGIHAVFESAYDAGMQGPAAFGQQATVGNLMGEGVLEGVLLLGENLRLVHELGGLQIGQAVMEV
jgi:hypothetical protein